jgi:hypothetical protein
LSDRLKSKTRPETSTVAASTPDREPEHATIESISTASAAPTNLTLYNNNPIHLTNDIGGWGWESNVPNHEDDPILGTAAAGPSHGELQPVRSTIITRLSHDDLYRIVVTESTNATEEWAEESISRVSEPPVYPCRTPVNSPMHTPDCQNDTTSQSLAPMVQGSRSEKDPAKSRTSGLWSTLLELLVRLGE